MKYNYSVKLTLIMFLFFSISLHFSFANSKINSSLKESSYVAASILKTLGAKEDFKTLIEKFENRCPNLDVMREIKRSISQINSLTSKKSLKIGYKFARKALKKVFNPLKMYQKYMKRKSTIKNRYYRKKFEQSNPKRSPYNEEPYYRKYPSQKHDDYPYEDGPPYGRRTNFLERKIKKGKGISFNMPTKGLKTNLILKKLCKGLNYTNAKDKLMGYRQLIQVRRKFKLILVIKKTLRRVLARILGCNLMRSGRMKRVIRKAMEIIRKKRNLNDNVFEIAQVLKDLANRRTKPKLIRRTNVIIKRVLANLLTRKKINKTSIVLLKDMKRLNCNKAKYCYRKSKYSRKCYSYARSCLKIKVLLNQTKAKEYGNVISTLIKKFISTIK